MEKRDEFDSSGETLGYISLDQAALEARRLARQDEERYLHRLGWDQIVWIDSSSEQREDSYRVVLQFRRPGRGLLEEQTGEEEFIFDLTGGLRDRQVLAWPEGVASGAGASPTPPTSRHEEAPASPFPPQRHDFGDGMPFPPFMMLRACAGIFSAILLTLRRLFARDNQKKD